MRVESVEIDEVMVHEQRSDVIQRLWRDAVLSLLQTQTERLSAVDPQHLSSQTNLVEVIFEAEDVADGMTVGRVQPQQRHVKLLLLQVALEALENDVQSAVRVQVEATCERRMCLTCN